jgi:3-oxoacyl-[acyl-carrier-protein] synthase II
MREKKKAGLVLGTMYGSVRTIAAFDARGLEAGPKYVKPFDFANSVINAAAGQTAIWHGLPGINSTVTGGPTASLQALAYAFDAIRGGRADVLLAGGAEELCFESYQACARAGLLAGVGNGEAPRSVPFDAASNGFALGEGAALLVLEELEGARARGATILAELRGHASTFDISRGEDSAVAAQAMERTVRLALEDAAMEPADVVAVGTSACGRLRADVSEAAGIVAALERSDLPVCAVKGLLGESMGAAGALQAVALLAALAAGTLPGIAGLTDVAPGCPLEGLTAAPRTLVSPGPQIGLITGAALDGPVSAVVLEAVEGVQ